MTSKDGNDSDAAVENLTENVKVNYTITYTHSENSFMCQYYGINVNYISFFQICSNDYNNSNLSLYTAINPEYKFCLEALITTLSCLYNKMLNKLLDSQKRSGE